MLRRATVLVAALGLVRAGAGGDVVTASLDVRERPDTASLLSATAALGNGRAHWKAELRNLRAHGNRVRRFQFRLDNERRFGFCNLMSAVGLTVNGIPWEKLQFSERNVRLWEKDADRGFDLFLNFDGAPVRLRVWMEPASPALRFEVAPSLRGLASVTNVDVRVSAVPSHLEVRQGRSRFNGYRRQVKTDRSLLAPQRKGRVPFQGNERLFVLEDADYDGTAEEKGNGPSAVILPSAVPGFADLTDEWTVDLHFRPDPAKPFRFFLFETPDRRLSNGAFEEMVRKLVVSSGCQEKGRKL